MYVRLFKGELQRDPQELISEMIQTVLKAESYLFSAHELGVLNYMLELPCTSPV